MSRWTDQGLLYGLPVKTSVLVPTGKVLIAGQLGPIYMDGLAYFRTVYGRWPFWTDNCRGAREVERERLHRA